MLLFTHLVDGYYELKNVLSIIITFYICINLVIVIDSGNLKITNLDRLIFTKNGEFTI